MHLVFAKQGLGHQIKIFGPVFFVTNFIKALDSQSVRVCQKLKKKKKVMIVLGRPGYISTLCFAEMTMTVEKWASGKTRGDTFYDSFTSSTSAEIIAGFYCLLRNISFLVIFAWNADLMI